MAEIINIDDVTEFCFIPESPHGAGLPFDNWWPHQRQAAEVISSLAKETPVDGPITVILEGPTGTGKSGFPATLARNYGVTTLVSTRDQQTQYARSFEDFRIVWGRAHYSCVLPSRIELFHHMYDEEPTFEDCLYVSNPLNCPVNFDCPYLVAKKEAMAANARVINYAYAFRSRWWRRKDDIEFCDEAHLLPDVLSDLVSIEINERTRRTYNLPPFPFVSGSSKSILTEAHNWARDAKRAMDDWLLLQRDMASNDEREYSKGVNMQEKLEMVLECLNPNEEDHWYVSGGGTFQSFKLRPVNAAKFAKMLFNTDRRMLVLMSATVGDPYILANEMELPDTFRFISLPHIIPQEQRPVILLKNAPAISSKSSFADYQRQADMIRVIMNNHPNQKGIIHTASWRHAELLASLLNKTDRVMLTRGERIKMVEQFKASEPGTVAISPSWQHGLDFKGDLARFSVIAKIPYLSLGDPVVALRLKSKGGRAWYDWDACIHVVQAAGRAVRGIDDWGITYIVDTQWNRVQRYRPIWFEVETI